MSTTLAFPPHIDAFLGKYILPAVSKRRNVFSRCYHQGWKLGLAVADAATAGPYSGGMSPGTTAVHGNCFVRRSRETTAIKTVDEHGT